MLHWTPRPGDILEPRRASDRSFAYYDVDFADRDLWTVVPADYLQRKPAFVVSTLTPGHEHMHDSGAAYRQNFVWSTSRHMCRCIVMCSGELALVVLNKYDVALMTPSKYVNQPYFVLHRS